VLDANRALHAGCCRTGSPGGEHGQESSRSVAGPRCWRSRAIFRRTQDSSRCRWHARIGWDRALLELRANSWSQMTSFPSRSRTRPWAGCPRDVKSGRQCVHDARAGPGPGVRSAPRALLGGKVDRVGKRLVVDRFANITGRARGFRFAARPIRISTRQADHRWAQIANVRLIVEQFV